MNYNYNHTYLLEQKKQRQMEDHHFLQNDQIFVKTTRFQSHIFVFVLNVVHNLIILNIFV